MCSASEAVIRPTLNGFSSLAVWSLPGNKTRFDCHD